MTEIQEDPLAAFLDVGTPATPSSPISQESPTNFVESDIVYDPADNEPEAQLESEAQFDPESRLESEAQLEPEVHSPVEDQSYNLGLSDPKAREMMPVYHAEHEEESNGDVDDKIVEVDQMGYAQVAVYLANTIADLYMYGCEDLIDEENKSVFDDSRDVLMNVIRTSNLKSSRQHHVGVITLAVATGAVVNSLPAVIAAIPVLLLLADKAPAIADSILRPVLKAGKNLPAVLAKAAEQASKILGMKGVLDPTIAGASTNTGAIFDSRNMAQFAPQQFNPSMMQQMDQYSMQPQLAYTPNGGVINMPVQQYSPMPGHMSIGAAIPSNMLNRGGAFLKQGSNSLLSALQAINNNKELIASTANTALNTGLTALDTVNYLSGQGRRGMQQYPMSGYQQQQMNYPPNYAPQYPGYGQVPSMAYVYGQQQPMHMQQQQPMNMQQQQPMNMQQQQPMNMQQMNNMQQQQQPMNNMQYNTQQPPELLRSNIGHRRSLFSPKMHELKWKYRYHRDNAQRYAMNKMRKLHRKINRARRSHYIMAKGMGGHPKLHKKWSRFGDWYPYQIEDYESPSTVR